MNFPSSRPEPGVGTGAAAVTTVASLENKTDPVISFWIAERE